MLYNKTIAINNLRGALINRSGHVMVICFSDTKRLRSLFSSGYWDLLRLRLIENNMTSTAN